MVNVYDMEIIVVQLYDSEMFEYVTDDLRGLKTQDSITLVLRLLPLSVSIT